MVVSLQKCEASNLQTNSDGMDRGSASNSEAEPSCVHLNYEFKKHCPFAMVVSLQRCEASNLETNSNCIDQEDTHDSESQEELISSSDVQESDNEILNNEIDFRINTLKNYQNQIDIQLKHLISLSRQNYVLHQNQEIIQCNDIFVWNLQDVANNLTNAGETLQSHSFEMIEQMSNCINDLGKSVTMDYSHNVFKKKGIYKSLKFKCNRCADSFNSKTSLSNHQTVHFKTSYACSKCNKLLYSQQSFLNHLAVYEIRQYVCQQCHKSFSLKSTLTNHLHVHNNTTDVCTTCKSKFQSRAKYLKHIETCSRSPNVEEDVIDFNGFLVE